jgi:FkbM family methyltransferase
MPKLNPQSDSYEALLWDVITNAHRYVPVPGHRVLDLGAHFGMFSLYCAARGANVVAYEPSPEAFTNLIHSAAIARDIGLGSIEPINAAVWKERGVKEFNLSKRSTGENSLLERAGILSKTMIPTFTLRDALRDWNWDCVKVDIEGAESETFLATTQQDLKLIRFLTMEIHNDLLTVAAVKTLIYLLELSFPKVQKLFVKKDGLETDIVSTILCWR